MGDSISSNNAEENALSCSRFLFFNYREFGDAHILHDILAYTLLVRTDKFRQRVRYLAMVSSKDYHWHTNEKSRMVHILASGVFFSGFLKDLLCIPRPLSPPLKRITMSSSAALEYGFPSTHSTNAVSVAVYTLFALHSSDSTVHPQVKLTLEVISYFYALSIILGRLYCGMHGFLDVMIGGLLGASLSVIQCVCGDNFDDWMAAGSLEAPIIFVLIILVLVRIHPEPADNCPCFDDSIAFAGVMIGVELGVWHYATSGYAWDLPVPATTPFQVKALGWPKTLGRIVIGVLTIFAWREVMKPTMLRSLPPIFRIVERLGLTLPRRFFVRASYVPGLH